MLPVAVIADDLTGAADTGILFCRTPLPAYLIDAQNLTSFSFTKKPGVLSVYTGSRHLLAEEASRRVEITSSYLRSFNPEIIYKKIDSGLRGNIGSEMDTILDIYDFEVSFIAPALPDQNRITVHDVHQINGVPLAETEMALDPLCPVRESRLSARIAGQSRYKVGRIDLDLLSGDLQRVKSQITHLMRSGRRHIVFDAATQRHLDTIALLGTSGFDKCLLAGSAGLAFSLARNLKHGKPAPKVLGPSIPGRMLWICGSASPRLARQMDILTRKTTCRTMMLDCAMLAGAQYVQKRSFLARKAARALDTEDLALRIATGPGQESQLDGEAILTGFTQLVSELMEIRLPAGLFLSGGDTASAILQVVGAKAIRLHGEIRPGVIAGTLMGGMMNGRPIITKAGSFGESNVLIQLHRLLFEGHSQSR